MAERATNMVVIPLAWNTPREDLARIDGSRFTDFLVSGLADVSPLEHVNTLLVHRSRKAPKTIKGRRPIGRRPVIRVPLQGHMEQLRQEKGRQVQRLANGKTKRRLGVSAIAHSLAVKYDLPVGDLIAFGSLSRRAVDLMSNDIPHESASDSQATPLQNADSIRQAQSGAMNDMTGSDENDQSAGGKSYIEVTALSAEMGRKISQESIQAIRPDTKLSDDEVERNLRELKQSIHLARARLEA